MVFSVSNWMVCENGDLCYFLLYFIFHFTQTGLVIMQRMSKPILFSVTFDIGVVQQIFKFALSEQKDLQKRKD